MSQSHAAHGRRRRGGEPWQAYLPLGVIVLLTMLAATAHQAAGPSWSGVRWMHDAMGMDDKRPAAAPAGASAGRLRCPAETARLRTNLRDPLRWAADANAGR